MAETHIAIRGAKEHNLKNISLDIPRDKLVVITGLSGSGKSSLAFDTIYAEGQRRYIESLSAYARQFLEQMEKPNVEHIEGLSPTISIQQRSGVANPRSTVATTTEIYDYLRLLYARIGTPHCHKCGRPIQQQTPQQIVSSILKGEEGERLVILAPLVRGRKGEHRDVLQKVRREGFVRARIDGKTVDLQTLPTLAKTRVHRIEAVVDRLVLKDGIRSRLADSIDIALRLGEGLVVVSREAEGGKWTDQLYSQLYACTKCNVGFAEMAPRMFSFNSPYGACPECDGLGTRLEFDPDLIVPDRGKSIREGAIEGWRGGGKSLTIRYNRWLRALARKMGFELTTPFGKLSGKVQATLFWGEDDGESRGAFPGVIPNLEKRFRKTESDTLRQRLMGYMSERACQACKGARLRPEALAVTIGEKSIDQIVRMSVEAAHDFFNHVPLPPQQALIGHPVLKEIRNRLGFMVDVGLGYLTLNRTSGTLSGGEAQRIRLATQVGSGLVGVCYVLDEPSIGLHSRDNKRLLGTLRRLQELGNSVLIVEHDEATIRQADWVVDLGPGAGRAGGHVVVDGPVAKVQACAESLTGQYMVGTRSIPVPAKRRKVDKRNTITVVGARQNNLKDLRVPIPLSVFVCVTGVSGSGKSTLVTEILRKALSRKLYRSKAKPGKHDRILGAKRIDKVVEIDQSPIGRTPRSNAATYTGVFDEIRRLFAKTKEARIRGYKPGRFSFNVKGGRCDACQGQGTKKIEMHFLPDIEVLCQECKGSRFNRETLEIRYRGKSIADVLGMSVDQSIEFFENFPKIRRMLKTLADVGLGYLHLGQSSTTLSGGEAQRVKLSTELGRVATGRTFYILDEPTTGLHLADVQNLLNVLNRLVDMGNTVLVIEHQLDVVKTADWIIDLGPEGGDAGGELVVSGTPEQVVDHPTSYTGAALRPVLTPDAQATAG